MLSTLLSRHRASRAASRDQGSMTVEMVILTPALVLVMLFVAAAGRMVEAQGQVDGAARDAARAASIQRDGGQVSSAAMQAASEDLNPAGPAGQQKNVCPGGMSAGAHPQQYVGNHATQVAATVTCRVNLLILPTLPVTGNAVAPVDSFVERNW